MNIDKGMKRLYQHAASHRFDEFDALFSQLASAFPPDALREAYLMRAQIKLFTSDLTFQGDLDAAERGEGRPLFPCLDTQWRHDAPNRFVVFPSAPGALRTFLQSLPQAGERMGRWYGSKGRAAVRQIHGEIHYFLGETGAALALANEQYRTEGNTNTNAILTQYLRFRCNLALGQPGKAEQSMLDVIRLSKVYPECVASYQAFRGWASLTTSWNGDSPRFYHDASGKRQPVLEDRLEGIRMGVARITPLEGPFVAYARRSYEGAYTMRQYYMDLFHAMYWLPVGEHKQTETFFLRVYAVALASGVNFPFVECGEQILPLLQYIRESGLDCSADWLDEISANARQYEEKIYAYQTANT